MERLDELALLWAVAKEREDEAKAERISIEEQILAQHPAREEGSETVTTPKGVKIKLVSRLKYKADIELLKVLVSNWDDELKPIKTKIEADESKLRTIRNNAPAVWAKLAPAITTEPAKVGVSVEFVESGAR